MDPLNQIIFDDKSFSDLLKEIHKNQSKKSKQLASLIAELRPLITSLGELKNTWKSALKMMIS